MRSLLSASILALMLATGVQAAGVYQVHVPTNMAGVAGSEIILSYPKTFNSGNQSGVVTVTVKFTNTQLGLPTQFSCPSSSNSDITKYSANAGLAPYCTQVLTMSPGDTASIIAVPVPSIASDQEVLISWTGNSTIFADEFDYTYVNGQAQVTTHVQLLRDIRR